MSVETPHIEHMPTYFVPTGNSGMKNSVNHRRITKIDCAQGVEHRWHIASTTVSFRRTERIPQMISTSALPAREPFIRERPA
jgi:hypothetical protein